MQDKLTGTSTHSEGSPHEEAPRKKSVAGRIVLVFFILAACAGGYYIWHSTQTANTPAAGAADGGGGGRGGRRGGGGGAVPVVTALVKQQDLPVYLEGIGSVTAFYTVTLKSRVDGELTEVDFKEGQDVKKGDQLAVIDPRPYEVALAQAKANLAKDQAQLTDARLDEKRYDELVKEGVIPQQQADTQKALADQLEGAVEGDKAAIDSAALNVTYSKITSPIDGRVGLRLVDPGNIVHAADTTGMLVITQMQPIAVIFTLPEDSLPGVNGRIRKGGSLEVKAYSRDDGTELATGMLQTIDNQIDQTTGTYKLKAVFNNEDRALWPNQFVNARLLLDTQKDALIVPSAAVQRGADGTFAYRVTADRTVDATPVTLGISQGNVTAITAGLSAGDQVVTDGQDRLRAGMQVVPTLEGRGQDASAPAGGATGVRGAGRRSGGAGQNGQAQNGQAGATNTAGVDPPADGRQGSRGKGGQLRQEGGNGGRGGGGEQHGQGHHRQQGNG